MRGIRDGPLPHRIVVEGLGQGRCYEFDLISIDDMGIRQSTPLTIRF